MLLRRVLRRRFVRAPIETKVLRRILRRGGCYRRRLEGRNTPFRGVRPPSRAPYCRGPKPESLGDIFETFSAFRARRARETSVRGGLVPKSRCLAAEIDSLLSCGDFSLAIPSPKLSLKMPPKLSLAPKRGLQCLCQNNPCSEGNYQTAKSTHHPHKMDGQHCACETGGGAYFAFLLGSDNSRTTPPRIPPDEAGLLWGWCVVRGPLNYETIDQERKSSPKSKFWGRISRGRPHGYPGGRPGAKTSVRPLKSLKNKHFGVDIHDPKARTSMTRGGVKKNFGQKNFGLNFRSLIERQK